MPPKVNFLQFQKFFSPFCPKTPFLKIRLFDCFFLCSSGPFLLVIVPSSSSEISYFSCFSSSYFSSSSSVFLLFSIFLLPSSLFPLFIANSFSNYSSVLVLANLSFFVWPFFFLILLLFCSGFACSCCWYCLEKPSLLLGVSFVFDFSFLGGAKGQVRWPFGPPHLPLNPPYLSVLVCKMILLFCLLKIQQKSCLPLKQDIFAGLLNVCLAFFLSFSFLSFLLYLFLSVFHLTCP